VPDRVVACTHTRTRPHTISQLSVAAAAEARGRLRDGLGAQLAEPEVCDVAIAQVHRTMRVEVTVLSDAADCTPLPTGTTADVEWD
jgi:hypothetical protein